MSSAVINLIVEGGFPQLGIAYTIQCNATEQMSGLSNRASLTLFNSSGQRVVSDSGKGITVTQGETSRRAYLFIQFSILRTSHAQTFTCMSILNSPALSQPLIQTVEHHLTVQGKCTSTCIYMHGCLIKNVAM